MSTTDIGRRAEAAVASYLLDKGYELLGQNWRTRWCEIDVVVRKDNIVSFVEVKYRKNLQYGGGLDYITSKKLQQMHFAADFWVARHRWQGDYELLVAAVTGRDFDEIDLVEAPI